MSLITNDKMLHLLVWLTLIKDMKQVHQTFIEKSEFVFNIWSFPLNSSIGFYFIFLCHSRVSSWAKCKHLMTVIHKGKLSSNHLNNADYYQKELYFMYVKQYGYYSIKVSCSIASFVPMVGSISQVTSKWQCKR